MIKSIRTGATYGGLIFGEKIHDGLFGTVFKAIDLKNKKNVVVKFINNEEKTMEMVIHCLLSHNNIVEMFYGIKINKKFQGLVMEYVEGMDLYDLIETKKYLDENEALALFAQMFSAIEYLHLNSIIHRDIKPENILIGKNGTIKICDFGFSTFYCKKRKLSFSCGSLSHASPEILEGMPYIGPEVDVWCLGSCLYMMVTGKVICRKDKQADISICETFDKSKRPYEWSPELEGLLRGLLDNNPLTRCTMDDIREHPWMNTGVESRIIKGKVDGTNSQKLYEGDVFIDADKLLKNATEKLSENKNSRGAEISKFSNFKDAIIVDKIAINGYPEVYVNIADINCPEYHIYNLLMVKMIRKQSLNNLFFLNGFVTTSHDNCLNYSNNIFYQQISQKFLQIPCFQLFFCGLPVSYFRFYLYCPIYEFQDKVNYLIENNKEFEERLGVLKMQFRYNNFKRVVEGQLTQEEGNLYDFKHLISIILN